MRQSIRSYLGKLDLGLRHFQGKQGWPSEDGNHGMKKIQGISYKFGG